MREMLKTELSKRINKLQAGLNQKGLDGCLISSNVNLYYFTGTMQVGYLYIPREGDPLFFVRRNFTRAVKESPLKNIIKIKRPEEIKELIVGGLPAKLGMELEILPVKDYLRLTKVFGDVEVEDISFLIRSQRAVKSPYELKLLKESGEKAVEVFRLIPGLIKEGMKDYELAAQIECEFRKRGHLGLIRSYGYGQDFFFGQVLVGENALVPPSYDLALGGHGLNPSLPVGSSGMTIKKGQAILVDYVANFNGYSVDLTRTFSLGKLPAKLQNAYKVAEEIQAEILQVVQVGTDCGTLYDLALQIATKYGLEQHFMGYHQQAKFVGHGIGLELNELPVLASKFKVELQKGMVIAIEPKFVFPDFGGVGLENTFVVGDKGLEKLTDLADEIIEI